MMRLLDARPTRALAGLAALLMLGPACNESSLTNLRAEFTISWADDHGFNEDVLYRGVIAAEDASLQFGAVTTGATDSIQINLGNPGTKDLDLLAIQIVALSFEANEDGELELAGETVIETDPEISTNGIGGEIPDGQSYDFELRFAPLYGTDLNENRQLYLSIKHALNWSGELEDGSGDGLYIPIVGWGDGDPVPDIYAEPGFIDFGTIDVGDTAGPETLTVGNAGPGLLEIANVEIVDTVNFSIEAGSVANQTFEFGDSGLLSVEFHPTTQGEKATELLIYSNDPDEAPLSIQVVGIANDLPVGKAPVAVCGPTIQSAPFEQETLDGTGSWDPSGLALTYEWTLTPPPGSTTTLDNRLSATPTTIPFLDLAGTYTGVLVVRNSQGTSSMPCSQDIVATPNENFRVELFWSQPDDMDLHLLKPGGSPRTDGDCYYANCVSGGWGGALDWGQPGVTTDDPSLDLDDINGTGPENTNIVAPAVGQYAGDYTIFIHDYTGTVDEYSATSNTVNIYLNGILVQTFNFQMSGENNDYYVAKIAWPSGTIAACSGLGGC